MLDGAARRKQVQHAMPLRDQPISDMGTVTMRRITLGTQDADRVAALGERGRRLAEWRRLHMLPIRDAAVATQRLTLPLVSDASRLKRSGERLA